MSSLNFDLNAIENDEVRAVFENYPLNIQKQLLALRELIINTAFKCEDIKELEETLKWGEPSYISKIGSTIRLGLVKSNPNQYAMFFHCKTKLIDTFKEMYGDIFTFEGNRAILFNDKDIISKAELEHCIMMSLRYHKIKNKPVMDL